MTIALGIVCVLLLVSAIGLTMERARLLRRLSDSAAQVEQLQSDLHAALRPPAPSTTAERAVRRVVRTASKVRQHGISGLIQSTVEDLASWASEEARADILNMAAADGTVTLFFSDIEDSTPLNVRLGDKSWVKVLAAHDRLLRARIEQNRGQMVKTAGDGFMVAFRDTEAACRAALGIQRDLGRDVMLRRHGVRVRIGIHSGQVVARDGDYFGRNVAMAARVADHAQGGEILASDAVREGFGHAAGGSCDGDAPAPIGRGRIGFDDPETVELKGLTGEHVVWRVVRPG